MANREMTLLEEFDYLLKDRTINQETHDRLVRKLNAEHEMYDQCRLWQHESDARCAVLEHDNRIQEQIILQLTYEKYKDIIEKAGGK